MSKRFQCSVSDEFDAWLTAESEKSGVAYATMATILLNEAKRNREEKESLAGLGEFFRKLTPDQIDGIMKLEQGKKESQD